MSSDQSSMVTQVSAALASLLSDRRCCHAPRLAASQHKYAGMSQSGMTTASCSVQPSLSTRVKVWFDGLPFVTR